MKAGYAGFSDDYQLAQETQEVTADMGSSLTWELAVDGSEAYAWFKDNGEEPVSTESSYSIASVSKADNGVYVCKVQSSSVPDFDIRATYILNGGTVIPVFESATTSEDGSVIYVKFDYDMADAADQAENFTVTIDETTATVTAVTLDSDDATTLVLSIDPVVPDDKAVVTLTYTPGALQGATGGAVAAFGPVDVGNVVKTGVNDFGLQVRLYPNPVSDMLYVNGQSKIDEIRVMDFSGKTIIQMDNINDNHAHLSLQDLDNGMYLIGIRSNQKQLVQKIVKN
ncbi:putative repeat protein (TIGR02059 family) [Roseimarinus sediminis]